MNGEYSTMNECGIYAIVNMQTGTRYIGGTLDSFRQRWSGHRSSLNAGTHKNVYLQQDWSSLGSDAFSWLVIELLQQNTGRAILSEREQFHIQEARRSGPVYNLQAAQTIHGAKNLEFPVDQRVREILRVPSDMISIPDAARLLSVSETYVRRMMRQGFLRVAFEGRIGQQTRRYFRTSDVEALRQVRNRAEQS